MLRRIEFWRLCNYKQRCNDKAIHYYGGDLGIGLTMRKHSSISTYSYVRSSGKITIGKNIMFGSMCSLFAENHKFTDIGSSIKSQGVN